MKLEQYVSHLEKNLIRQQGAFINRLKLKGHANEETIVSNKSNLEKLYNFLNKMGGAKKIRNKQQRINYALGKLGEEAVKKRLDNCVLNINYDVYPICGDGKVDLQFRSKKYPGIQVKTRCCQNFINMQSLTWSITKEEIFRNSILCCVLYVGDKNAIHEKLKHKEPFSLIIAGFLPTDYVKYSGKKEFTISELLYAGNLKLLLEEIFV